MASTLVESNFARLTVDVSAPVARIVLCHASLNVIDIPMMGELAQVLGEIEARSDVSIIVLSGEGNSFSAGVDVAAHTTDKVEEMLNRFHTVVRAFIATKKVTVAAVHGNCLGGGAELAMVCDIVYTSTTAKWGFPEIKLGCFPPVACTALAALVGQKRASELILSGRTITGVEAEKMGLANHAVQDEKLVESVEDAVRELRTLSPAALAVTKKAIYAWDSMHFDKGLARAEKIYLEELIKTMDSQEGIRAFTEKREPRWLGK
jgi:cyclohexa-1,5-dienecarbonyl-CoA hydratase